MTKAPPRLRLVRELGAGTTGRVDLALLEEPHGSWPAGQEVAVKRLHPELIHDPEACRAFDAEAAAGLAVSDPSLVRVLDAGQDETGPWIIMEFVRGMNLREAAQEHGSLPEPLLRDVGSQIAGALAALHAVALVHGDVKPENVRLDPEGRAVLVDLGFAAAEGSAAAGSLPYLAPERAKGGPPTTEADVFALGLALFELAIGAHPLLASDGDESATSWGAVGLSTGKTLRHALDNTGADRLLASLATARFAPPSRLAPRLSPLFDRVILETLQRRPEARPTAAELSRQLREGESGAWWREQLTRPNVEAPARVVAHLTPLVGRELEWETLRRTWQSVRQGAGALVRITGPAGSGKSRLMSDFAEEIRGSSLPPLYLYTRCSELEESRPQGSLLILLRRWLQLPRRAAPGQREIERLRSLLTPDNAETLLRTLGPGAEDRLPGSVGQALVRWIWTLARDRPVVVFVDDLHHARERTLATLGLLLRKVPSRPLLVALAMRTDEAPAVPDGHENLEHVIDLFFEAQRRPLHVENLELLPIGEEAVQKLVAELFHSSTPRLRLANVLWLRSRGNPGLMTEVLRDLIAKGQAHPRGEDDPALVLSITPDELPLPGSLHRMIARRYEGLGPQERLWLERLAVVGGRILPEFLQRAFPPTSMAELDEVLPRLVSTGWLTSAGARYRFARPALREAVYRSLSKRRRVRLHAAAGRALADENGEGVVFQRAFHLRAAGEHAQLLEVLEPLVRTLLRRGQPQRVHDLAVWGLEALDALPEEDVDPTLALEFLEIAADAADRLGLRGAERRLLDRLAEMELSPVSEPAAAARVYLLHGRYAVGTGQYGLARGMLRNAVELAEQSKDLSLRSDCLRRLAMVQTHIGELAEARKLATRAVRAARTDLQRALGWMCRAQLDVADDRPESALRSLKRATQLLRSEAEFLPPGAFATALMLRARILHATGQPGRALGAALRALRLARQSGERRLQAESGARLGGLLLGLDRVDEAEERLRDAMLTADEIEDRRGRALAGMWLGVLLWERGDPDAHATLHRTTKLAREMGFYRAESLGLSVLARTQLAEGRFEDSLNGTTRAMELLERHGSELLDRIVILGSRAMILEATGSVSEARALVRALRRRMKADNMRIRSPLLREAQRAYSSKLLEAVISPDGPVYPRVPAK